MASQIMNNMDVLDVSTKLQKDLEESLISRILNAVEIFMKEEDRLPKNGEDDSTTRFRDLINFFLIQKKDFDILSPNYATLLHFVVKHGDNESFKSLLDGKSNFDVNAHNSKGTTLMHVVAINGTCQMMQELLDRGADINIRTGQNDIVHQNATFNNLSFNITSFNNNDGEIEGYTPLHCAAYAGNFEVLRMLLNKGADINAISYYGTPLHFACGEINGNLEHDYLLKKKSYWSEDKKISDVDRAKLVQMLLDRGARIDVTDSNRKTALQRACFNANLPIIEVLLDHVAPI
ncbi:ankyrin-1-like [Belonocnema kinseyi]|uniref:ankyrin-1-like n=1 Tax=Belonocnema kinseyi TaxID=2817044 RepID=UPI00143D70B9|nr:ankyrin-1-like [Belonocnema kinseyi]